MATILVVDDDVPVRQVISRSLGGRGHLVLEARDGVEALELLGSFPIDLAIVDLVMPRMHGLELMRRMRQHFPGKKVVVISAFDDIIDLAERELDIVGTFKKPFVAEDLADAVERALNYPDESVRPLPG